MPATLHLVSSLQCCLLGGGPAQLFFLCHFLLKVFKSPQYHTWWHLLLFASLNFSELNTFVYTHTHTHNI